MISDKAKNIPPFIVMDVLERAQVLEREGRDIIHLQIGEPDFPTPLSIKNAGIKALLEDDTHYTHSLGKLELREAISENYHRKYGVTVSPDNILVAMGSSSAMLLLFSALLNPGDEVIISDPGYPCYQIERPQFRATWIRCSSAKDPGYHDGQHLSPRGGDRG